MPSVRASTEPFEFLIVDDEAEIRELLAEYFRGRGDTATVVSDGRAAVAAVERDPARFRVVFVDLHLPGLDGLSVLEAIKLANPSAYVVIITGYASLDSAIQAVRLGAYDYLTKPFSIGQIEVVVQRILDRLALERENRQLARRISERHVGTTAPSSITDRLDIIDAHLATIEQMLSDRPVQSP